MNKIFLFVDDLRNPEDCGLKDCVVARTSIDAINILKKGNVGACSLDHDLGGEDTGYAVVCWMEEHNVWPDIVFCHSQNPVGRQRINSAIERHRQLVYQERKERLENA